MLNSRVIPNDPLMIHTKIETCVVSYRFLEDDLISHILHLLFLLLTLPAPHLACVCDGSIFRTEQCKHGFGEIVEDFFFILFTAKSFNMS